MLTIPNRLSLLWGVPVLVLYLYAVWAAIVAVIAWVVSRATDQDEP